jgi:hypothetical protein
MKRALRICWMVIAGGVGAYASQPIAAVSGSSSFELDGSLINTAGITAWPLMPGDRLMAGDSPLLIAMKDGSRITLAPHSQLRFDSGAGGLTANLISGDMQFKLASGSALRILRSGAPGRVTPQSGGARPELLKPPPPNPVSAL